MLLRGQKFRDLNRYSDILAFKHSRVHLLPRPNLNQVDPEVASYINANFVDGPLREVGNRAIIACQGPKQNTVGDFWRMVAQENVTLIVMTCSVYEQSRMKCFQYWPESDDADDASLGFDAETSLTIRQIVQKHSIDVKERKAPIWLTDQLVLRSFLLSD